MNATAKPPEQTTWIGRYEVVGHLADGGMAEIVLGRILGPSGFQRPVVIKRILPHLARQHSSAVAIAIRRDGYRPLLESVGRRRPIATTLVVMGGDGAFVGRNEELGVLAGAVSDALGGRSRFVLLTGEPGIGKTSLAMEAARRTANDGSRVASGRAWEGAGAPVFWLWRECLRDLGGDIALPAAIVGDESRFAALEGIAERVRAASRDALLVLVLDDLQWADVPSLLAFKLLARTARSEHLCVIATIREPSGTSAEVAALIADVKREMTVLAMGGLARADLAELVRTRGVDGERAIDAIARATGGNALFALELLGDSDARGALDAGSAVPAPRGVRDVLNRHLARLGDGDRDVVAWAAACGQPIDSAAIAHAAMISSARVAAAIDAACREGILSRGEGAPRFAHDLFRSAAYDGIPHERRARMHDAFARVLGERDPNGAARIRHLFAADPTSSDADVARAAMNAARAAITRMSYEEAVDVAQKAADVFERAGRRAELATALATIAEARVLGGDAERSATDAERALAVARESGDAVAFARAALAVGLRRTMGMSSGPLAAALDEALARLEAEGNDDRALRCAVEARLAAALQPNIDTVRAVETGRRAIARARATGDPEIVARTLHGARPAFRMLEPLDERTAMDRELLALAERLGDEPLSAHAHARVFWSALEAGDAARADATLLAFEALVEKLRLPHHELVARSARCVRELMHGNFERAEEIRALIDATRDRWRPATAAVLPIDPSLVLRMSLAAARGEALDVDTLSAGTPPELRPMMKTFYDARAGRHADASASFPAVVQRYLSGEGAYMMRVFLGDTCGRIGDEAHADRLYELCLPLEGRHIVLTPLPGYDGAIDRILGSLANVRGDRATALRHYDAAIAMEEKVGAAPFAARSRAERAALAPASARLPVAVSGSPRPTFVREGEIWLVTFGAETARMKDADGLRYLAHLVARPDVVVPVVELFAERATARGETAPPSGDAGEVLDPEAIVAYRARARDLRERLDDAEARNNRGAAEVARKELAFLEAELSRAVGLGGRSRRAASDAERIRVNVTTRIRKIIGKLSEHAPRLGRHLEVSVRTGSTCTYQPP